MNDARPAGRFYFNMGLLLLGLLIAGFGSAAIIRGTSPLELPTLFHLHGLTYIIWFLLFITQAHLIGNRNHALHRKLGEGSLVVIIAMLVTGFMIAGHSYDRGISPIPDTTIQQFLAFPMMDLVGIFIFYSLGILKRSDALFHKHCMLVMCIAIMDPGIARIALSIGIPPLAIVFHLALVGLVIFHDRKTAGRVHPVTWMGLAYVILRVVFIMTVGGSEGWASLMDTLYG